MYVGLYGYSYLDAGRNVMTLFQVSEIESLLFTDIDEPIPALYRDQLI